MLLSGYVVYRPFDFDGGLIVIFAFDIRTEARNGLVIFIHGKQSYFLIQFVDGALHAEFNDGYVHNRLVYHRTASIKICDGSWNDVRVFKRNQRLGMSIRQVVGNFIGNQSVIIPLTLTSNIYIGGIPPGSEADTFVKTFGVAVQPSKSPLRCFGSF